MDKIREEKKEIHSMRKGKKPYGKRVLAWMMLVVMGINSFGQQIRPGVAKVQAAEVSTEETTGTSTEQGSDENSEQEVEESSEQTTETSSEQGTEESKDQTTEEAVVYDSMTISTETTLTEDLEVGDLAISQPLHLNGNTITVHGNLILNSTLYIEEGYIAVEGNYQEENEARLVMESYNDSMLIRGDYIYANAYRTSHTRNKGTFAVGGDIRGKNGAVCSTSIVFLETCEVQLCGDGLQTIEISPISSLQIKNLTIENTSDEGVLSKHMLKMETVTDDNQKLHYPCQGSEGMVLTEDTVIEGDFCLMEGELDLAGFRLEVTGDFIHAGGEVNVHGGTLHIDGDYKRMLTYVENEVTVEDYSLGRLIMRNESDYVFIHGDYIDCGIYAAADDLTAGVMEIQGNITARDDLTHPLFETTGTHTVKLTGDGVQLIQSGSVYTGTNYRFSNLIIQQGEAGSVVWDKPIAITNGVAHHSSNITGTTRLEGGFIESANLYGDIVIPEDYFFVSDVTIHGNLTAGENNNTLLSIEGCHVTVKGNYTNHDANIQGTGSGSVLTLEQNMTLSASNSSTVSNLVLQVAGDIVGSKSAYVSCGEDAEVQFLGTEQQHISNSNSATCFTNVILDNPAGVVVEDGVMIGNVTSKQGTLSYVSGGVHGFTLEEDMVYEGDLSVAGGTLNLNGHKLHVQGNLTFTGGVLQMTQESDSLLVDGDFSMASGVNHTGKLTNGVLEVMGNFSQSNSGYSFVASGNHKVIFSGDTAQTVTFANMENSYFNHVEFVNQEKIVLNNGAKAFGQVHETCPVEGSLYIGNTTTFTNGSYQGNVRISEDITLQEDWTIGGDVYVSGGANLFLNGYTMTVEGTVVVEGYAGVDLNGHLICENFYAYAKSYPYLKTETSTLTVHGAFIWQTDRGTWTAGSITVGGDVTFSDSVGVWFGSPVVFEFAGTEKQTLTMNSSSHCFGKVILNNSSTEGIYVTKDFNYREFENVADTKVTFADGGILGYTLFEDTTVDGDLLLSGGIMDLNGYTLTVKGNLLQGAGTMKVNGGNLVVEKDYAVAKWQSGTDGTYTYSATTGYITMTDVKETITVQGDFYTYSKLSVAGGNLTLNKDWMNYADFTGSNFSVNLFGNVNNPAYNQIILKDNCTVFISGETQQSFSGNVDYISLDDVCVNNPEGLQLAKQLNIYGELATNGYPMDGWVHLYGTIKEDTIHANVAFQDYGNINQDLYVDGNAHLVRFDLNGYHLTVEGDCTFSNVEYGSNMQEDGILEIKGNLIVGDRFNYSGTGTNQVILSGDEKQIIYASNVWKFAKLVINNTSEEGVYAASLIQANTIIDPNHKLSFAIEGEVGYTLTEDTVIQGDFTLLAGTMDLNGYQLTVMGDMTHRNGTLVINQGTLQVQGDYTLGNLDDSGNPQNHSAKLLMDDGKDTMYVEGDVVLSPCDKLSSYLVSGTLETKGDVNFDYCGSGYDIISEDWHLVLSGNTQQQIINQSKGENVRLGTIDIQNTSAEGVVVTHSMWFEHPVTGSNQLHGTSGTTVVWANGKNPQFDIWEGNLQLNTAVTLEQDLHVAGNLVVHAALDVNGHHLVAENIGLNHSMTLNGGIVQVKKDLTLGTSSSSSIAMTTEEDILQITGDFIATTGKLNLTAGQLEVKGNVNLKGATVTAGENHTTTLSGKMTAKGTAYIQEITMADGIVLNKLVLTKPRDYYVFSRDVEGMCQELMDDIQDIIPPEVPEGVVVTEVSYTKATISWNASTDDIGIAGYDIYRNDKKLISVTGTSYTDQNLQPETEYRYCVVAKDATMNTSAESEKVTITTLTDDVAPHAPKEIRLSQRMGTALKFVWEASTDNVKTTEYRVFRDGEQVATTTRPEYTDKELEKNQSYTYTIVAVDEAGNESQVSEEALFYTQAVAITSISPEKFSALSGGNSTVRVDFLNVGSTEGYQVYIGYRENKEEEYTQVYSKRVGEGTAYRRALFAEGTLDLSSIESETFEVLVRITDAGGYETSEVYTYTFDQSAPKKLDTVGGEMEEGVAMISYAKGTEVDIAGYYIYRKTGEEEKELLVDITDKNKTYYYDKTVEEGVDYTYYVAAYDADGHIGELSDAVLLTGNADNSQPVIESVEPVDGILYGEARLSVTARDNKALDKLVVEVLDAKTDTYQTHSEYSMKEGKATCTINTTGYPSEMVLRFTLWDASGNQNETEYIKTYQIDNDGPGQIGNLEATVTSTTVMLSWDAPTDDDFSYFLLEEKQEDATWKEVGRTTNVTGYVLEGLAPQSSHTYRVSGVDIRENKGEPSKELTITVGDDTIAPRIVTAAPNGGYYSSYIPLTIQVYDNIALQSIQVEYSTDQETWNPVTTMDLESTPKEYTLQYDFALEEIPEGDVYLRAYGTDTAGNEGEKEQVLIQYVVDRTAPSKVSNFVAKGESGSIALSWSEPVENDVAGYRIYRSVEGLNSYQVLASYVTTLGYYDKSAAYDVSYTYRITAMDKAGNESELSDVVIAQKLPDSQKPTVHSLVPVSDAWISGEYELSAYVSDNDHITSVEFVIIEDNAEEVIEGVETAVATKVVIDTVTTDIPAGTVTCKLDTTAYANSVYQLLITAKDASGNVSETYTSLCHIANISLPTPDLYAEAGDWCTQLHYSGKEEESYILYKKKETEDSYTVLKTGKGSLIYQDKDVDPDYQYSYLLVVEDQAGNKAQSNVMRVRPNPVDSEKPTVVLYGDTSLVEGYETIFYGNECTDNHKIVSYAWDFGDGETGIGPTPVHAYSKAGDYNVTLTVTDASGNTADKTIVVTVLPKESAGKTIVEVRNLAGTPLSGVTVFVNTSSERNDESYTNSSGIATIRQKPGTYRVALYKPGYVATEVSVEVELHGERSYVFTLPKGDTISADFTVKKMTFEEMVEAGIDLSDPDNQHVFTVKTGLSFDPASRPIENDGGGMNKASVYIPDEAEEVTINRDEQEEDKEEETPIIRPTQEQMEETKELVGDHFYHTIYITQFISWLKDMYEATLIVYNNASSQTIVAQNLNATIACPSGVSLAGTYSGQSATKEIADLRGGESQSATWYLRGDTPGKYKLHATLNGTLAPFGVEFVSEFESNSFDVTAGEGLVLTIKPEDRAEKGEQYYVYFILSNEGRKEFYNVNTTFGTQKDNSKRYITSVNGNEKLPVIASGDMVAVDCLKPGESISGIYRTSIPVEGEKYKDYMRLVDYESEVLQGSNLGVSVRISPVGSHVAVPRLTYQQPTDENSEADPVNVSTGAYTDSIHALSVQGVNPISADLQYDSTALTELGEFGYGWTHNYESFLKDMQDGTVRYYVSPSGYYTFLAEDYEKAEYKVNEKGYYYLDPSSIPMKQNYKCLNENEAGYVLKRLEDGSFQLTDDAGSCTSFDKKGQMTSIKNRDGKKILVERSEDEFTVTDFASERSLTYILNDDKLICKVEDNTGREVYFYYDENKNLKQFTNALGESTYYTYDDKHRLLTVTDDNVNTYVKNVYDDENRVVEQKDAFGYKTKFSYTVDKQTGDTTTYVTTRSGKTKKTVTDAYGHVTLSVNEAGDETATTYDENGNQTAVNNANGYSVVYNYDSDNNMTSIENSLMDGDIAETVMTYDGDGNMLSMENCDGESMSCTYNDQGLIETVTDQNNNTIRYEYNQYGQLEREIDGNERAIEYLYDENFDLIGIQDKNGNVTTYTYNELGLQSSTTITAGEETYTTYTYYDDLGRVDYTVDTEGGITSYEYDCAGNIISRTDPAGAMTVFSYDKNYQLIRETIYPSEAEGEQATSSTTYTYNQEGLLKTITDGVSGTVITNTYDEVGNKIGEVEKDKNDKELSRTVYEYDKAGNITKETAVSMETEDATTPLSVSYQYYPNGKLNYAVDTAGKKTTYSYDKSWRVSTIKSETDPVIHYTYDDAGRVTAETVGEGSDSQTVAYEYDIYGNVITATDNAGVVTKYRYDNNGNLTETEDATGKVYYSKYDALNRVTEMGIRKPNTTEEDNIPLTTIHYSITNHTVTETDVVNGGSIVTYYDMAGRPYKSENNKGKVLSETIYDTEGRTLQSVDANGLVTEYVYNDLMQIEKLRQGEKSGTTPAGMYLLKADTIRETTYTYDDLGRNTQVTENLKAEDGSIEPVISSVVYDGLGRIQSLKDPNQNASSTPVNTYEYTYYENGLLETEKNAIGNVTEYSYNAQMLLETVTDSAKEETTYTYDSLNRIQRIQDGLSVITYVYDENNNIKEVIESDTWAQALLNSGKSIQRDYDELNRITSYKDYKDREIKYTYDDLGNLDTMTYPDGEVVSYEYYNDGLMKTMTFTSSSGGTGYTWEYTYDSYGRLKNIKRPDGTEEERVYDEVGKLIEQIDKDEAGKEIQHNTYTYNTFGEIIQKTTSQTGDVNQLEVVNMTYNDANRLVTYNGQTVEYDVKGNMTRGPVDGEMATLTYDTRNRLTSAGGVSYEYDAENVRIASTENGLITEYVTDTSGTLSQLLTAYEADGTRTIYVYGAEGLAGQYNSGTKERLYYHYDNIGSTTCVTNQEGTVVEAFTYGTYGELLSQTKKNIRFLYNGSYGVMTDSNGLYYMRARYYNPDIKRFINQDIKVGDISNGQGLNRYAYCEGNPISMVDPFGLCGGDSQNPDKEINWQSEVAHLLLGIGGMLPVVGFVFDLADVALYCYEKDTVGASIALACAIPGIGLAVGSSKLGVKVAKIGGLIADSIRASDKLMTAVNVVADTTKNVRNMLHSGVTDITAALALKGKEATKLLKQGGEGLKKVGSMLKKQGEKIYTSAKKAAKKLAGSPSRGKRNRGYIINPFYKGGSGTLNHGIPNNPKTVRRFMSKQEYKQFKKQGFVFDPNDSRGGISSTSTKIKPNNPDMIKRSTGALGADYYVDIDVGNKNIFFKGITKGGVPDWKIQDNVDVTDIVNSGRVKK